MATANGTISRLLSWIALLLLSAHVAAAAPRLPAPDRPLSIEARQLHAIVAGGRAADIAKAGRSQAPEKRDGDSGDAPLSSGASALPERIAHAAALTGPVPDRHAAGAAPSAYQARAPPPRG